MRERQLDVGVAQQALRNRRYSDDPRLSTFIEFFREK
jgi:hypothetical protein